MKCHEASAKFIELVDDELPEDEARVVRGHLADCERCRAEYSALAADRRLLGELDEPRPAPLHAASVYAAAAARAERKSRRWRARALAACSAMLLTAGLAGTGVRLEVGAGRFAVSWREAGDTDRVDAREVADARRTLERHEERLADLDELVGLVARRLESNGREQKVLVALLEREIAAQRRVNDARLKMFGRSVHALHLAQHAPRGPAEVQERFDQ